MSTELLLVCETSKSLGTNENPNTKKISLKHFMFLADTYVFGLTLVVTPRLATWRQKVHFHHETKSAFVGEAFIRFFLLSCSRALLEESRRSSDEYLAWEQHIAQAHSLQHALVGRSASAPLRVSGGPRQHLSCGRHPRSLGSRRRYSSDG